MSTEPVIFLSATNSCKGTTNFVGGASLGTVNFLVDNFPGQRIKRQENKLYLDKLYGKLFNLCGGDMTKFIDNKFWGVTF